MKTRRLISTLLAFVYIFSICGYSFVVLTCHCGAASAQTAERCACHHCRGEYHGEGITQDASCHCLHSHSTQIELYDYSKSSNSHISSPLTTKYIPSITGATAPNPAVKQVEALRIKRKIPLPHLLAIGSVSLRAPPSVA